MEFFCKPKLSKMATCADKNPMKHKPAIITVLIISCLCAVSLAQTILRAPFTALTYCVGDIGQMPSGWPTGGPYTHKILSASSVDGLNWTRDAGVRLEHASVPCAVADGNRILLYFVDADRRPGKPESVNCAVSYDGIKFEKQPFVIAGIPTRKAVDPSVLKDANGLFRLYYFGSDADSDPASQAEKHEIHLALSDDGIRFREVGVVFRYPGLVDPDVFFFKGMWFMYVFGDGNTCIATSPDGYHFSYRQELGLPGYGTVAPLSLNDRRLRLYAFEQRKPTGNAFVSFLSTDGINWSREEGVRLKGANNEQITDPFVIRWKGSYKMYFKIEQRDPNTGIPEPARPPQRGAVDVGNPATFDAQGRPNRSRSGPWNNDVCVYRIGNSGTIEKLASFERAGVPTVARLKDGRLIAAHQHFSENNDVDFDKVAVHFSSDEGKSWTAAQIIRIDGLSEGMRFPFDPTLVPLPDGRVRLYFTSLKGRLFEEDRPAIYSAVSSNGIDYKVEPGVRFGIEGRPVIDCAVVLHQGVFHLYAPDNSIGGFPGEGGQTRLRPKDVPRSGTGYHATSKDGLQFTRQPDVQIEGGCRWLGSAQSDGKLLTFFGTGEPGIWMATSEDGQRWKLKEHRLPLGGADPGAVRLRNSDWLFLVTGPPRIIKSTAR